MDPGEEPPRQDRKEKSRNLPVSIDTSRSGPSTAKPFRGSWLGSETTDNDEDIEVDYVDRTEVAIATLGAEIQELGEGVHLALGDRLGEDHLKSFPWISPGSAPGSGKWPKTPDSALSEHAKAIKEELKNQTYEALIEADEEFHKLMEDLEGITKWWTQNRKEWREKRADVIDIEEIIDALKLQMRSADVPARLEQQIKLQNEKQLRVLEYFPENEKLMKSVVDRFKKIEAGKQRIQKVLDPDIAVFKSGIEEEYDMPEGFDLRMPSRNPLEIDLTALCWWDRGFAWWLENALKHLQWMISKHRGGIKAAQRRFEVIDKLAEDAKTRIEATRADTQVGLEAVQVSINQLRATLKDQTMNAREFRSLSRFLTQKLETRDRLNKELEDEEASIKMELVQYHREQLELRFDIELRQHLLQRATLLDDLGNQVMDARNDERFSNWRQDRTMQKYVACLYSIFCSSWLTNWQMAMTRAMLSDMTLQYRDKARIFALFQGAWASQLDRQLLQELQQIEISAPDSLKEAARIYDQIPPANEKIMAELSLMIRYRAPTNAPPFRTSIVPEPLVIRSKPKLRSINSKQINPNQAQWESLLPTFLPFLDEKIEVLSGEMMAIGPALRAFFTSPDIAPKFWGRRTLSTNEFEALVNSFLFKPLKTLHITAFLVLCNCVDDLFNLNDVGSEVTPSALGWELVVENGIAGPPRRHNLLKPEGAADIERLLLSSWKTTKCLVVETGAEITQDELYAILAEQYIPNVKLDKHKLAVAIDYFTLVGIFFVFSENKDEKDYNLLKFVDNGWDPEHTEEFLIPKGVILFQDYFQDLVDLVLLPHVKLHVYKTHVRKNLEYEGDLYDTLKCFWTEDDPAAIKKGDVGYVRQKVTRHRFHLFLRWSSSNNSTVGLYFFYDWKEISQGAIKLSAPGSLGPLL